MGICGGPKNDFEEMKGNNLNGKKNLAKNGNKKEDNNNNKKGNTNKNITININKVKRKKKKINNVDNNEVINNNAKNSKNTKVNNNNNLGNSKISEKEIKINDNICISNIDNDGISVSNITKTSCLSEEENVLFPKGEQRYELNKDSNESILIGPIKKNFRTKLLLSFSLDNITNPKDKHSFGISIINNKYIGNKTFLGKLENKKGENIEYDKLFEIDYIFESEQIIIIEPIINDIKMEIKKKLTVYTLIAKKNYELLIENIGTLKINYTKLEKNIKFNTELSKFNFSITLNNKTIFNSKKSLEDIFLLLKILKMEKRKGLLIKV